MGYTSLTKRSARPGCDVPQWLDRLESSHTTTFAYSHEGTHGWMKENHIRLTAGERITNKKTLQGTIRRFLDVTTNFKAPYSKVGDTLSEFGLTTRSCSSNDRCPNEDYAALIRKSIAASPNHQRSIKGICKDIMREDPWYRQNRDRWQQEVAWQLMHSSDFKPCIEIHKGKSKNNKWTCVKNECDSIDGEQFDPVYEMESPLVREMPAQTIRARPESPLPPVELATQSNNMYPSNISSSTLVPSHSRAPSCASWPSSIIGEKHWGLYLAPPVSNVKGYPLHRSDEFGQRSVYCGSEPYTNSHTVVGSTSSIEIMVSPVTSAENPDFVPSTPNTMFSSSEKTAITVSPGTLSDSSRSINPTIDAKLKPTRDQSTQTSWQGSSSEERDSYNQSSSEPATPSSGSQSTSCDSGTSMGLPSVADARGSQGLDKSRDLRGNDDDDDNQGRKRKRSVSPSRLKSKRQFACIYHKFDPAKYCGDDPTYKTCQSTGFEYISYLIKHLKRVHKEYCCQKCFYSFPSKAECESHQSQCVIHPSKNQEDRWAAIWTARFGPHPVPRSPFLRNHGKSRLPTLDTAVSSGLAQIGVDFSEPWTPEFHPVSAVSTLIGNSFDTSMMGPSDVYNGENMFDGANETLNMAISANLERRMRDLEGKVEKVQEILRNMQTHHPDNPSSVAEAGTDRVPRQHVDLRLTTENLQGSISSPSGSPGSASLVYSGSSPSDPPSGNPSCEQLPNQVFSLPGSPQMQKPRSFPTEGGYGNTQPPDAMAIDPLGFNAWGDVENGLIFPNTLDSHDFHG